MTGTDPAHQADEAGAALAFVTDVLTRLDEPESGGVLEALTRLRMLRDRLNQWEPQLIDAARAEGVSWVQLAPALGVASRQAAERRYLRIKPNGADPSMNGEQRVEAARAKRASDRAVTTWAHDNAADLRLLAGQVVAAGGSDRAAQVSVGRVHDALSSNDSAALLEPLADAGPQLSHDHPGLAERISAVGDQTDAVRQARQQRPPGGGTSRTREIQEGTQ
ncbi:hypothetical protein AB0L70_07035 [Kribbella sp. NPDC051952]|uniref:hypothetical protein n=1 Tax=Kribbella sp. NPDC051952 TaxID=3154851 RepID=UPI003415C8F9